MNLLEKIMEAVTKADEHANMLRWPLVRDIAGRQTDVHHKVIFVRTKGVVI